MCQLGDGAGQTDSKTKIVGGDTIAGQIASFIDTLHLSYKEVFEELPYLLLLLMNADKPRPVYGEEKEAEVKMVSGKDMLKVKRGG